MKTLLTKKTLAFAQLKDDLFGKIDTICKSTKEADSMENIMEYAQKLMTVYAEYEERKELTQLKVAKDHDHEYTMSNVNALIASL